MNAFEKLLAEVKANATVNNFTDAFKEVKPSVNPAFIEVELPKKQEVAFEEDDEDEENYEDDIQDWDDLSGALEKCSLSELRDICAQLNIKFSENRASIDAISNEYFYDALTAYTYVMYQ